MYTVLMEKNILMCKPDFFGIEYEINPWMHTEIQADGAKARDQWQKLHNIYQQLDYQIELVDPVQNLPDMVFTANGGLVIDSKVMLPRFKCAERQPETKHFEDWFRSAAKRLGFTAINMPESAFEGEGDALLCGDVILAGWGFRSDKESHQEVEQYFQKPVVSLHLVNPNFYHLDTALAILDDQTVAYYPGAFDEESQQAIESSIPRTIKTNLEDAKGFGLNAMSDGQNVVLSDKAPGLVEQLEEAGFTAYPTPITEFRKSGGGVKCLTLALKS